MHQMHWLTASELQIKWNNNGSSKHDRSLNGDVLFKIYVIALCRLQTQQEWTLNDAVFTIQNWFAALHHVERSKFTSSQELRYHRLLPAFKWKLGQGCLGCLCAIWMGVYVQFPYFGIYHNNIDPTWRHHWKQHEIILSMLNKSTGELHRPEPYIDTSQCSISLLSFQP